MKKLLRYVCAAAVLMLAQSAMAQEVTTVINEDFAAFAEGSENAPATTDISSGYPSKLSSELSGWSGRYVYEAGGALMIADNGNLQTARYSMKANNGIIKKRGHSLALVILFYFALLIIRLITEPLPPPTTRCDGLFTIFFG